MQAGIRLRMMIAIAGTMIVIAAVALLCIGSRPVTPQSAEVSAPTATQSGAVQIRYVPASAFSMEKSTSPRSREPVKDPVAALKDANPEIQAAGLEALARKASPEGKDAALKLLAQASTLPAPVTARAVSYLGRISAHEAFQPVHDLAMTATDPELKSIAIRNLVLCGGRSHPKESVAVVEPALLDENRKVQNEAVRLVCFFPQNVSAKMKERLADLAKTPKSTDELTNQITISAQASLAQLNALAQVPLK